MLSRVASSRSSSLRSAGLAVRSFHASPASHFIIRTFEDVKASGNVTVSHTKTWESRRYLLRKDGLGFSFHHTILYNGTSTLIHYRNHVEAVMITAGEGEIELVKAGQKEGEGVVHKLVPGTMYALNGQERHFLRATKGDLHVVCAFNPPLTGVEDHNEEGVYPAVDSRGNQFYNMDAKDVENLVEPPESLKKGTPPLE